MTPELSRYLAIAFNSPYWAYTYPFPDNEARQEYIDKAEKVQAIADLPKRDQMFLKNCADSAKLAKEKGVQLPYTREKITPIIKEILTNATQKN